MSVDIASEIWDAMSDYLCNADKRDAADTVVSILIDRDFSADEIKSSFSGNKYIRDALEAHLDADPNQEEEEFDGYDDEFDDDY